MTTPNPNPNTLDAARLTRAQRAVLPLSSDVAPSFG